MTDMAFPGIAKRGKSALNVDLDQQGAKALLAATFKFLKRNNIATKAIVDFARQYHDRHPPTSNLRLYKQLVRTYDDLGVIMARWFSDPKFLDPSGHPVPLSQGNGSKSIAHLIRASGARVKPSVAIEFMRQSPSIRIDGDGHLFALRRVFVLPRFEVPRAAFVVERYLDTLLKNVQGRGRRTALLLERTSFVSKVNLTTIAPILRDIDGRGTAFMDSVDGEIEGLRLRNSRANCAGELGVLVFAWMRPDRSTKARKRSHPPRKHAKRPASPPNADR
jgi:hypothetical protein